MLKLGGPDIPLLLLNLFSLSLSSSQVPMQWKHSIVTPLHKSGTRFDVQNYRPINHTSLLSKIFERIIKSALMQHINSNNLIHKSQHGFLHSRSSTSCQLDFLNHVTSMVDSGSCLIIVFLDLRKAFDCVPHELLVHKLHSFGIVDPLLSWFSSYLRDRTQSVYVNSHYSDKLQISSGVIQGSVLGPLLFLLYINDIFSFISSGKAFLFADDIKIVYSCSPLDVPECIDKILSDLSSLEHWCSRWSMVFSTSKCSILSHRCQIPTDKFSLHNASIPSVSCVRDLGLNYSITFNFSEHVSIQVAKARKLTALILRTFQVDRSRVLAFKMYVRPLLEYCSFVFSNMRKADRLLLEKVQRSFTKAVTGYSSTHNYRSRCAILHLDPLWLRRLRLNLVILFRLIHNLIHSDISNVGFKPSSVYNLRLHKHMLPYEIPQTSVRSRFFLQVYSRLWNKLPALIRSCCSLSQFKHLLSKLLTVESLLSILDFPNTIDHLFENGPDL